MQLTLWNKFNVIIIFFIVWTSVNMKKWTCETYEDGCMIAFSFTIVVVLFSAILYDGWTVCWAMYATWVPTRFPKLFFLTVTCFFTWGHLDPEYKRRKWAKGTQIPRRWVWYEKYNRQMGWLNGKNLLGFLTIFAGAGFLHNAQAEHQTLAQC